MSAPTAIPPCPPAELLPESFRREKERPHPLGLRVWGTVEEIVTRNKNQTRAGVAEGTKAGKEAGGRAAARKGRGAQGEARAAWLRLRCGAQTGWDPGNLASGKGNLGPAAHWLKDSHPLSPALLKGLTDFQWSPFEVFVLPRADVLVSR